MKDYNREAEAIIAKMGITFKAVLIGSDCPLFCGDAEKGIDLNKVETFPRKTHIHGRHYRCTFSRSPSPNGKIYLEPLIIDFWNSYNDEEFNYIRGHRWSEDVPQELIKRHGFREGSLALHHMEKTNRIPSAYGVLACLQKSDPGDFEEFCGLFGYDTDSRRAETIYHALVKEWGKVSKFFTREELPLIQEIA